MRFAFTDDQTLFAEGLRDLLAKECTPAHVRAAWDDGAGHDFGLWNHLAELGVFGCSCPKRPAGSAAPRSTSCCCSRSPAGPRCRARSSRPRPSARAGARRRRHVGTAALDGSPYVPHADVASVVLVPGGVMRPGRDAHPGRRDRRRPAPVPSTARGRTVRYDEALAFDRGALPRPHTSSGSASG